MATYKRGSGNYKSSYLNIHVKTADQIVNNSETIVDCTDLVHTLKANTRYSGMILLRLFSATGPDYVHTFKVISGTVYAEFISSGLLAPLGNPTNFATERNEVTDGAAEVMVIYFWLETGSSGGGTIQYQFAQDTATASNTTVKVGSTMVVYEG